MKAVEVVYVLGPVVVAAMVLALEVDEALELLAADVVCEDTWLDGMHCE